MHRDISSFIPTAQDGVVRDFATAHDNAVLYLSLALLVISSADNGPMGTIAKLCWLASFASLALTNVGAAFVAYVSSLAMYSPLHFEGWGFSLQRPDNYALVLLVGGMLLLLYREQLGPQFNPYILAAVAFFILHAAILSRTQLVPLFRDIAIPLLACEGLKTIRLREREMDAMQAGMAVLGGYVGLVSILERISAYDWILPPWVGDLSLRPFDPFLQDWLGSGRSGGILLQPAWNGLLLTLILFILLLRVRRTGSFATMAAMLLCIAGSFFTYTRGVWLGLGLSLMWFPGWCRSLRQAYFRRAALACITIVLLVAAGGMVGERLHDSGTIYYRLNLWGAGLRLVMAHPLLGVGFFNFGSAMTTTQQGFGSVLPSLPDIEGGVASHNTLLTVLVEFGILGFLFYVGALWIIVRRAISSARQIWGPSGAAWVLGFVVVYLVNAQFVSAFEGATNTVFFAFLGAIAGCEIASPTPSPARCA